MAATKRYTLRSTPAYTPRMRVPARCSISLFCTSRRATAVLSASWRACSERRIKVRASLSWPLWASAKMRSSASQNWRSESARYFRCSASRSSGEACASRARASSRSVRMRRNCPCHAVSGYGSLPSSMSRMARPSEFRLFWMRRRSSESARLRSMMPPCRRSSPRSCSTV